MIGYVKTAQEKVDNKIVKKDYSRFTNADKAITEERKKSDSDS